MRAMANESERTAAELTVTMLGFPQRHIGKRGTEPPGLRGELGSTAFRIMPDDRRLLREEFVDWLIDAPKPVFAIPTYARGVIAVWPHLSTPWVDDARANIAKVLASYRATYDLDDASRVLVGAPGNHRVFPYAHLEEWGRAYGVEVGWHLRRVDDRAEADVEMVLVDRGHDRHTATEVG